MVVALGTLADVGDGREGGERDAVVAIKTGLVVAFLAPYMKRHGYTSTISLFCDKRTTHIRLHIIIAELF